MGIDRRFGSIPAWAGETKALTALTRKVKVYPRVGGGNLTTLTSLVVPMGLSPRGRGKPT